MESTIRPLPLVRLIKSAAAPLLILVKQVPPKMIESRRLNTKSINDFVDALSASNMYDQLNTARECDPNENYNILHSIISNSINEHFPSKLIKFKKPKHKHNKWITRGIIKSIIYRDDLNVNLKKT